MDADTIERIQERNREYHDALAKIASLLFEPVSLPVGMPDLLERIVGAIEQLYRERAEARTEEHRVASAEMLHDAIRELQLSEDFGGADEKLRELAKFIERTRGTVGDAQQHAETIEYLHRRNQELQARITNREEKLAIARLTIETLRGDKCRISLGVDGPGCGLCPACARDLNARREKAELERDARPNLSAEDADAFMRVYDGAIALVGDGKARNPKAVGRATKALRAHAKKAKVPS